ncbi:type II toxin-antitoxin system mRNA interferase toxin, RelE/StbE family [Candidatus Peregrinibacteria bacterium]|nr:type II toxin-antitoxin system mRNA interferase toxin, RelE/StbE family [Candidatus Peregrinibacteria bacterium]
MKKYKIIFDDLVWKEDFRKIDTSDRKKIFLEISKKLPTHPHEFGKHLSGNLSGYKSLRIGEFRIVYRIYEAKIEVLVVKIGFRRNMEVYIEVAKRLGIL